MSPQPSQARVWTAMLSVWIIWGATYLAMRYVVEAIPPYLGASFRFLAAGSIITVFVARGGFPRISAREWWGATVAGTLMLWGGNGNVMWAEQYVTSSLAALVIATVPLWMAALEPVAFGGARPGWTTVGALVLGFLGVGYLVYDPGTFTGNALKGVLVLLLAACLWALGSLFSRKLPQPRPLLAAIGLQMVIGGVVLAALSGLRGEWPRFHPLEVPWTSWVGLAFLIIFGSVVAYTAYVWLLAVKGPTMAGTYAFVNPIVAVALGAWIADEPVTMRLLFGGALIVASVVVLTRRRPGSAARPGPAAPGDAKANEAVEA